MSNRVRQLGCRIAALSKRADAYAKMQSEIITVHLLGGDIGPDDDDVSVHQKAVKATRMLMFSTGARGFDWDHTPKPRFSFRTPKPRRKIIITLEPNDTYTVEIIQPGVMRPGSTQDKTLDTIRGVAAEQLKRKVEKALGLFFTLR